MRPAHPFIALLACSCLAISSAWAGIYKWVDENGQVHYGERPAEQGAERLRIRTRSAAPATKAEDSDNKAASEAGKQNSQPAAPQATPDEWVEEKLSRKQKRSLCKDARQRLASIQSRARLKETDAKGNVRALSPKERANRIRQTRKDIRDYCR